MQFSESVFATRFNLTRQDLERYLEEALSHGGDYADLYFEYLLTSSISIDESIVKSAAQGVSMGVGVRVIAGERTGYAYSDDLSPEKIRKAARTVQQQTGTKDPLKVLRVEIALDRCDPAKMRPGMRFQGKVELGRVRDALLVPRSAVFVSPRGPVAYRRGVFGVEMVPLRLGAQNDELVRVLSGLSAHDRVMLPKKADAEKEKA